MNLEGITDVSKRYDFKMIFDVKDGNPNGDPDAGNMPRVDSETMQGIVTDVALKRKIRDYILMVHGDKEGNDIYVKQRGILENEQKKSHDAVGKETKDAREWMCNNYFDVRMFGAVMNVTKYKAGQVLGPMQLTFARSVDPVMPQELTITRVALTNNVEGKNSEEAEHGTMGRKAFIPYGIYEVHGYYTPAFAEQTGVTEDDLKVFWESLVNMWDLDHSAARGMMSCQGLYVFKHDSKFGNAPSNKLFETIKLERKEGVGETSARSHKDYEITVEDNLPSGVTLHTVLKYD